MIVVGIDPGLTGAWAAIDGREFIAAGDMPVMARSGGKRQVNAAELANVLRRHNPARVVLEQVHSMRGQGVASMFSFGMGYGTVIGVVAALGIPIVEVSPQAWKRSAKLIGADKDMARTRAIQAFPDAAAFLTRKKDVARAEAILIALAPYPGE